MDDFFDKPIFPTKGKRKNHLLGKDIILEAKPTRTQSQQAKTQKMELELDAQTDWNHINHEIWYYVSKHIEPEDVKSFALICKETAALVNTKSFWKSIYIRYVNRANQQIDNFYNFDIKSLRIFVTRCLFCYYPPLIEKLFTRNKLSSLIGRIYCTSWCRKLERNWIMAFKFKSCHINRTTGINKKSLTVVDNWESLLDENDGFTNSNEIDFPNYYEGEWILVLFCRNFTPFPSHLIYENENRIRLLNARTLLYDMQICGISLEFVDTISTEKTIVDYPQAIKYNVLPWWHPQFEDFVSNTHK